MAMMPMQAAALAPRESPSSCAVCACNTNTSLTHWRHGPGARQLLAVTAAARACLAGGQSPSCTALVTTSSSASSRSCGAHAGHTPHVKTYVLSVWAHHTSMLWLWRCNTPQAGDTTSQKCPDSPQPSPAIPIVALTSTFRVRGSSGSSLGMTPYLKGTDKAGVNLGGWSSQSNDQTWRHACAAAGAYAERNKSTQG